MRVAVFTGNQPRHLALVEALAGVADVVHAVQECKTVFPGQVADFYRRSEVMQAYFRRVIEAERDVFGPVRFLDAAVPTLALKQGDLNLLPLDAFGPALEADHFVVFGASFIKGALCEHLVERGAVNLHMGVSPYYRGASCNFWALHDDRPELVGATIHLLSRGLDSGPMLFHALPLSAGDTAFHLGMHAVRVAIDGLVEALRSGDLAGMRPVPQDRALELRYARNADFDDAVASAFLERPPAVEEIQRRLDARDPAGFVRPYCR